MPTATFRFDVTLPGEAVDGLAEDVIFDLDLKTAHVLRNGHPVALPTHQDSYQERPITLLQGIDADSDGVADTVWLDVWFSFNPTAIPVEPVSKPRSDTPALQRGTTGSGDGVNYYTRPVVTAITQTRVPLEQGGLTEAACYDLAEGGQECRRLSDVNGDHAPETAIYDPAAAGVRYEFTLPHDLPYPAEGNK